MGYVAQSAEELLDIPGLTEEDRERLRVRYERWDKLLDRGCLVRLHITAWRATATIDEQALELMGIPFREEEERKSYKAAVRMGQLNLLPSELRNQQNRLEQRARTMLDTASRDLIVGHFVPETQVVDLLDRLQGEKGGVSPVCSRGDRRQNSRAPAGHAPRVRDHLRRGLRPTAGSRRLAGGHPRGVLRQGHRLRLQELPLSRRPSKRSTPSATRSTWCPSGISSPRPR